MDDYLTQLRDSIAEPREALCAHCQECGRRLLYRAWPARGDQELAAFLDGLNELVRRTGLDVYGFWMLEHTADWCQLWRGRDRHLVVTASFEDAVARMVKHGCPAQN
jgi:hypothetical protein